MDDAEANLKKAVSKAKKSFWKGKEKTKTKFITRKQKRKIARTEKKAKKRKSQGENEEDKEKVDNPVKEKKGIKRPRKKKVMLDSKEDKEETKSFNEDDKVIASMEKKLKLKRKKSLPSVFVNDGLDYLLEVCEPFMNESERRLDNDKKRTTSDGAKRLRLSDEFSEGSDGVSPEDVDAVVADSDDGNSSSGASDDAGTEDLESPDESGSESVGNTVDVKEDQSGKFKEVTVATSAEPTISGKKYIPPQLRKLTDSSGVRKEELDRVRKQVKGNLNRLSEMNLASIARSMEEIYASNSRNDVSEILMQLILEACITPSAMPERLLMENAMLIAILSETVGSEVGASLLQVLAEKFHHYHEIQRSYENGKECNNIVLLLAQLYNFKVTDTLLISDIIHELVKYFKEADIEMLLLLLRTVGPEIRRDDPGVLKELILEIQSKAISHVAENEQSRVRFMLEILTALRNNNLRKIPRYDPDTVDRARKVLRQILKGKEGTCKLRISLGDLLAAQDKGRWWIVGSAWVGETPNQDRVQHGSESTPLFEDKLVSLARQQRMTTDVKKNIFCVMMSSEDYLDAFEKLLKLNLKEKQARELVHVLVDCCLQEKSYNPFYAYLAQKLCSFDKTHKVTFQYTMWDKFKVIPAMKKHSRHNLASLLAYLFTSQSLSLSVLKVVSFGTIDKESINFFKDFFTKLILQNPQKIVRPVFTRIATQPKLSLFREGLKVFLEFFLLPQRALSEDNSSKPATSDVKRNRELIESAIASLDELS